MKIAILINNVYGIGGTNRTVLNLAAGLTPRHQVEIVSVFRRAEQMSFEVPYGVTLRPLVDLRPGARGKDRANPLRLEPTAVVPPEEEFYEQYSVLSDQRLIEYLQTTDADVVVGTRSSLNLFIARFGRDDCVRIAQEHMTHLDIPEQVRAAYLEHYPRLDAITTVTEADAEIFRQNTPVPGVPLRCIPNSVPDPGLPPADPDAKLVVAAGRLHPVKRYDLLVRAFDRLKHDFPDWALRIYGVGPESERLRTLIRELGATDRVLLMGSAAPLDPEWVKGSIAAVTSEAESFGMTVVEAMRCGVPVVSTDCPVGPREIIDDGVDGLLVAPGDIGSIAEGLRRLMSDRGLRAKMAEAALTSARRYDPAAIAETYAALFAEVGAARGLELRDTPVQQAAQPAGPGGLVRGTTRALDWARRRWSPGSLGKGGLAMVGAATGAALRVSAATGHVQQLPGQRPVIHLDLPVGQEYGVRVLLRESEDAAERHLVELPATAGPSPLRPDLVRLTAELDDATVAALHEGRWSVLLETASGLRSRPRAGTCDVRAVLGRSSAALERPEHADGIDELTAYRSGKGNLVLRRRRRARHAECTAVERTGHDLTVHGILFGAGTDAAPRLVLRRRGLTRSQLSFPGTLEGRQFRIDVPAPLLAQELLGHWEDWDAWLALDGDTAEPTPEPPLATALLARLDQLPGPGTAEAAPTGLLRVGRILPEFMNIKQVYAYPPVTVADSGVPGLSELPAGRIHVRPYFTVDGDLAFQVVQR